MLGGRTLTSTATVTAASNTDNKMMAMKERSNGVIEIEDFPYETVLQLMEFFYKGATDITEVLEKYYLPLSVSQVIVARAF